MVNPFLVLTSFNLYQFSGNTVSKLLIGIMAVGTDCRIRFNFTLIQFVQHLDCQSAITNESSYKSTISIHSNRYTDLLVADTSVFYLFAPLSGLAAFTRGFPIGIVFYGDVVSITSSFLSFADAYISLLAAH